MLTAFVLLYQFSLFNVAVNSLPVSNTTESTNTSTAHLSIIEQFYRPGSDVTLVCPSNEAPTNGTFVLWSGPSFNYSVISTDMHPFDTVTLSIDKLEIRNISSIYEGNYSCSQSGKLLASWSLIVLDTPQPPSDLKSTYFNESAISLRWKSAEPVSKSVLYEVHVTGSQNKSVNVSAVSGNLLIGGLDPFSLYHIRLQPHDKLGYGEEVTYDSVCTYAGTPKGSPVLTLTAVDNTSAAFDLSPGEISLAGDEFPYLCQGAYKPPEHLNGPFLGFRLSIENLSAKSVIQMTLLRKEAKSHTFDQLAPFTQYRVNASLNNGRMFGPPTVFNFTTKEGVPGPPILLVDSRSVDSLGVSLYASKDHGRVEGYLIKWRECSNSSTVAESETTENKFTIGGLRSATCYQLQAAARTAVGYGSFSPLTQDFTSCPEFAAPLLSNITAVTDAGIQVTWEFAEPPPSPGGLHWFLVCMRSSVSSVCKNVFFDPARASGGAALTSLPLRTAALSSSSSSSAVGAAKADASGAEGAFSYVLPFHGVNLLGGRDIVLNFTVQSICLPRDCKIDWPCQALSEPSNVVQLNLDQLAELVSRPATFEELSDKAIGGIIGAVFTIFPMICCVGALSIVYCRFSRVYKRRGMGGGGVGMGSDGGGSGCESFSALGCIGGLGGDHGDEARTPLVTPRMRRFEDSPHRPIPAHQLAAHVASYHVDDDAGYQAEFEAIEQSVRTSWPTSVARLPDNMDKNRYTNVFAYDHTRVVLKNGRKSDYINANYVDGFCRPRAFIAAQGPKDSTFDDFWQMVWDENSNIIVMISNFVERGRRKCDQYWPASGPQTYGNISVQMLSENYLACYVARVFLVKNVKCKKFAKERIVRHYQYTDWRDFDVPPSPLPVLVFVKTTVKEWTPSRGPIIVHCSAGVGRTGTYICIESLIRQLEMENQVNIRGFLEHIRQQRMKLVQTEQQYAFIHDALREFLLCPEHEIPSTNFTAYVQRLRQPDADGITGLQKQFEICTEYMPRIYEFTEARKAVNAGKNRLPNRLLPTDSRRVVLPCSGLGSTATTSSGGGGGGGGGLGDSGSYINASVVQGYHRLHEFILTQHPIGGAEGTEADFWRMVWDKNCAQVLVLSSPPPPPSPSGTRQFASSSSDASCNSADTATTTTAGVGAADAVEEQPKNPPTEVFQDFWPTKVQEPREIGWLRVGYCNSEEAVPGLLTRYEFLLSSSREDYALTCQLWRLRDWPIGASAAADFLRLHSALAANHAASANGSTIVVDDYGGNRAGIYVAVNFLINQLTLSGCIDVYYIVKMLHLQRTGIFQSPADLEFIYNVMEQYLLDLKMQDDSSSFLGGGNDSSSSPGYANLSLFNGKHLLLHTPNGNGKPCAQQNGVADTRPLFPLNAAVHSKSSSSSVSLSTTAGATTATSPIREIDPLEDDSESTLELGDLSISPSLIGVLTPVKRANGFVVRETVLPSALPPPPNQSPPPWPQDDLDPTPTTSLVFEADVKGVGEEADLTMTV